MNDSELNQFAQRYAEAWSSHNPEAVIAFYAKNGAITVNDGPATPVADVARGFMRDFPDLIVTFDKLEDTPNGTEFDWSFTGTNTGPGGTANKVRISGYEVWKIDNRGLIAESKGLFDAGEYDRQLRHGVEPG